MNTKTLEQANTELEQHKADAEIRVLRGTPKVGTVIQQGDVYLHCVPDDHPRGKLLGTQQIALGTSTGARHVIERGQVFEGKRLPAWVTAPGDADVEDILGPVVVGDTELLLTHPEHPHHRFPAGTWQVTYPWDHIANARVSD